MAMAETMHADGWAAAGYNYLNVDDCWQDMERDERATCARTPTASPAE